MFVDDNLASQFYMEMCRLEHWDTRTLAEKIVYEAWNFIFDENRPLATDDFLLTPHLPSSALEVPVNLLQDGWRTNP